MIEDRLLDWEIEKFFSITVDNTSANIAVGFVRRDNAWKGYVLDHIRCGAHIIN